MSAPSSVKRFFLFVGMAIAIVGCAGARIGNNVGGQASGVAEMQIRQVLYNTALFMDNPSALPSQVTLSGGSVSEGDTLSLGGLIPIGPGQVSYVPATATTPQTTTGIETTAATFTPSFSGTTSDNISYTPVTDPAAIARLSALYYFVLYAPQDKSRGDGNTSYLSYDNTTAQQEMNQIANQDGSLEKAEDLLQTSYPLIRKQQPVSYGFNYNLSETVAAIAKLDKLNQDKKSTGTTQSATQAQKENKANQAIIQAILKGAGDPNSQIVIVAKELSKVQGMTPTIMADILTAYVPAACDNPASPYCPALPNSRNAQIQSLDTQQWIPDEQYLYYPVCVICMPNDNNPAYVGLYSGNKNTLEVNHALRRLHSPKRWLLSDSPGWDHIRFETLATSDMPGKFDPQRKLYTTGKWVQYEDPGFSKAIGEVELLSYTTMPYNTQPRRIFIRPEDKPKLTEFAKFILMAEEQGIAANATAQAAGMGGAGGGGGGSQSSGQGGGGKGGSKGGGSAATGTGATGR